MTKSEFNNKVVLVTCGTSGIGLAFCRKIAEGVLKRKNNLILTPVGKLGYYLHRISPVQYEKIMVRQFQSELA